MPQHRRAHTLGGAHAYPARHGDGDLRAIVAAKRHDSPPPRREYTIAWCRLRSAGVFGTRRPRNSGGGPDHQPPSPQDASCGHRRVVERTHAERHVDALFKQIDGTVVQNDVDTQFRMLVEKGLKGRQMCSRAKVTASTDAQAAREPVRRFACCLFGLIRLIDCTAGVLVESLARIQSAPGL